MGNLEQLFPQAQVTYGAKPPTTANKGDIHVVTDEQAPPPPPPQNVGGLKAGSSLPPALPQFGYDADTAFTLLGMEYAHRSFLAKTILERAVEANDLHDALLAVVARSQRLENELAEARSDRAQFEQSVGEWQKLATDINAGLETELAAAREERDQLRDELGALKLRKRTKE